MDLSAISELIGSNYFPIALCLILLYWINKLIEHQREIEKQHTEEMLKMTEAINNNTTAITLLSKNIDEWRKDKEEQDND